jgi:transposase
MGTIRKSYTAALKAKVVQEALAGEKTLSQIASEYGIHANMITKWKRIAVQAMPETLEDEGHLAAQIKRLKDDHEREKEELYAEIGRLTTQVHWLQKKIERGLVSKGKTSTGRMGTS